MHANYKLYKCDFVKHMMIKHFNKFCGSSLLNKDPSNDAFDTSNTGCYITDRQECMSLQRFLSV